MFFLSARELCSIVRLVESLLEISEKLNMHGKTLTNAQITITRVSDRSMRIVHGIGKLPASKLTYVLFSHYISKSRWCTKKNYFTHILHFDYPNQIQFFPLVSLLNIAPLFCRGLVKMLILYKPTQVPIEGRS